MPDASVIIITRNRKELAKRAVQSALSQNGEPEVVVIDDASDDGTASDIRSEFPSVRVYRAPTQEGCVVQRNKAVEMCTTPVVFSIDDDAEFADPRTIHDTLKLFQNPAIGAVSIPFINRARDGTESRMVPPVPDERQTWISHTFIGTAFAVRREVFLRLGGFQGILFHWGEEGEYCQRLMNAGFFIAMGTQGLVVHYPEGVGKYSRAVNRYIYRNGLLTLWFNAPTLLFAPLMLAQLGRYTVAAARRPRILPTIFEGCLMALKTIFTGWRLRRPITLANYRLWMRVRRARPVPLSQM